MSRQQAQVRSAPDGDPAIAARAEQQGEQTAGVLARLGHIGKLIELERVGQQSAAQIGSGERFPGHWAAPPQAWAPEGRLLSQEVLDVIEREIDRLPPAQRAVITMRDVQGLTSEEVCNALDLTETNQRVLLHRARAKVRTALEEYMR